MDLQSEKRKKIILQKIKGKRPCTYYKDEKQYFDPNTHADVTHETTVIFVDDDGQRIDEEHPSDICQKCNKKRQPGSFWKCPRCYRRLCDHHKSRTLYHSPDPAIGPAVLCKRCMFIRLFWLMLFFPLLIIWEPLKSIFGEGRDTSPSVRNTETQEREEPSPTTTAGKHRATTTQVLIFLLAFQSTAMPDVYSQRDYFKKASQLTAGGSSMRQEQDKSQQREKAAEVLLEKAHQRGLDLEHVSARGFVVCRTLSRQIRQRDVRQEDVAALAQLLDLAEPAIDSKLDVFIPPGPDDGVSIGDFSVLRAVSSNIPVAFTVAGYERGLQFFSGVGQGKSTLQRRITVAMAGLNLPVVAIINKPDGFFWTLQNVFADRCLVIRLGIDPAFYNPFYAVGGGGISELATSKLPYMASINDRWDSLFMLIDTYNKSFIPHQNETGAVAPTLRYFMDTIPLTKFPNLNPSLKTSLMGMFTKMRNTAYGKATDCQKGLDLKQILEKRIILILDCSLLDELDTHFIVAALLADFRKIIELNPSLPNLFFLLDEAGSLITSRRWESGKHASPLSTEATLLRGSRIMLSLGFHTLADITGRLRANAGITLIGALAHGEDIKAAAHSAALTPEQTLALSHLRPGIAVLKMTGCNYTEPFLVSWDPPEPLPPVSESERQANYARILSKLNPIVPADYRAPVKVSTPVATTSPAVVPPTGDWLALLEDLHTRPFLNVTERVLKLNLPSKKVVTNHQLKIELDQLKNQGLCDCIIIQSNNTSGIGGSFFFPTALGHTTLGSLYKPARSHHGHDFVQRFIQHILADKHITAIIEGVYPGSTKMVDLKVLCPHSGFDVAIEVCLSTFDTEPSQALADLNAGFQRVITCCITSTDLKTLKASFKKAGVADTRISACVVSDLKNMKSLMDIIDNPAFFV